MKLSIITVNLNNRGGLQKTIDSVVPQTFRDFEWIVIDGGSTDGSKELIEQYADHFAYWVSEPDKGIYNAMNKGIKLAKGEYLQFLNSGDWLHDNNVLKDVFSLEWRADIIYCDYEFFTGDQLFTQEFTPEILKLSYLINHWIGHNASFIKRILFDNCPYDEKYTIASDWKFFIQQAILGKTFLHHPIIVSCLDNTGISVTNQEKVIQERHDIITSTIPQCILYDIEDLNKIIGDQKIMKIKEYKDSCWLYRKIILTALRIIRFIENIRSRKCK